jgi:hypothetical protein
MIEMHDLRTIPKKGRRSEKNGHPRKQDYGYIKGLNDRERVEWILYRKEMTKTLTNDLEQFQKQKKRKCFKERIKRADGKAETEREGSTIATIRTISERLTQE